MGRPEPGAARSSPTRSDLHRFEQRTARLSIDRRAAKCISGAHVDSDTGGAIGPSLSNPPASPHRGGVERDRTGQCDEKRPGGYRGQRAPAPGRPTRRIAPRHCASSDADWRHLRRTSGARSRSGSFGRTKVLPPVALGISSRSAVVRTAVRLLQANELGAAYQDAWKSWARNGDADLWETTVSDGMS